MTAQPLPPSTSAPEVRCLEVRRLERQIAQLRIVVALMCVALAGLGTLGVSLVQPGTDVVRAERLEIVEPDGSLAFVLSNSARPEAATIDGVKLLARQEEERRTPSFVFFDGKGDEVGGMMFRNESSDDGFSATRHFSLDGYKQDQTVVLHHYQDARGTHAGLSVSDRPDHSILQGFRDLGLEPPVTRDELNAAIEELSIEDRSARLVEAFGGAPRAFVGRTRSGDAALVLSDGSGRPRIELRVPEDGEPVIRILDVEGNPVLTWPES